MNIEGKWKSQAVYNLLGLRLVSNFPFSNYLESELMPSGPGDEQQSLFFHLANFPPFSLDSQVGELVYSSPGLPDGGKSLFMLRRFKTCDLASFDGIADFYIQSHSIICHLLNPAYLATAEEIFIGLILGYWLEIHAVPVIHASAVVISNGAVAFPSHRGSGKSSLAAAFVQAGNRLLSDDILPLDETASGYWGRPGLPQFHFWPTQQVYFTGSTAPIQDSLPIQRKKAIPVKKINFAAFCNERQLITCFYLPFRSGIAGDFRDIKIIPLKPAEAVIELVRNSTVPNLVESLHLQAERLAFFARLVQQVPVRRLVYPSGFELLPRVVEAVLQDLVKFSNHCQDRMYAC
jgi:hypothetical protein